MNAPKKEIVAACCQQIRWEDLDLEPIRSLISLAIAEDTEGSGLRNKPLVVGDPSSSLLSDDQTFQATLRARDSLTVCGLELIKETARAFDPRLSIETVTQDGQNLSSGDSIAILRGPLRSALTAERTILNFLQRLSGIATSAKTYVDALCGSSTRLLDTRKTTPGYRYLEKYAVACGGGWNHRMGLFDRVMLKDNHLAAFSNDLETATIEAVTASRTGHPGLLVEMEVDRIDQIDAALKAQVDIILLDNFSLGELSEAKKLIGEQAVTEISGNVTLDTLTEQKKVGCDFISTGALVHKSTWVDIGLDWD